MKRNGEAWLRTALADGEWHPTTAILAAGKAAGYSRSVLYRLTARIGVEGVVQKAQHGPACWRIVRAEPPDASQTMADVSQTAPDTADVSQTETTAADEKSQSEGVAGDDLHLTARTPKPAWQLERERMLRRIKLRQTNPEKARKLDAIDDALRAAEAEKAYQERQERLQYERVFPITGWCFGCNRAAKVTDTNRCKDCVIVHVERIAR